MTIEMRLPRPLYYFLVTTITQFILASGSVLILLPTGLVSKLPWEGVGFLMVYNVFIATLVAMILGRKESPDEADILKGGGLVLGHLMGLIVGGFLGGEYGGAAWAIGCSVVLYFVGGWIGAQISRRVGYELEHAATAALEPPSQIRVRRCKVAATTLFTYGAVIPLCFMAAAVFVKSSGLPVTQYPAVLPTARVLLALLSVFSILVPWMRRTQGFRHEPAPVVRDPAMRFVGMGLCLAPAVFGFLLFVAFGMSIAELSLFAVAASIATTTWGVS